MRKLISLGLLAIIWSLLASPVVADGVEDCDVLVDATPGLYGLCIAWHHAGNENARQKILDNYDKIAVDGDLPMPGSASCPCWTIEQMAHASASEIPAYECTLGGGFGFATAVYGTMETAEVSFTILFSAENNGICQYSGNSVPLENRKIMFGLDEDTQQGCRDSIAGLVLMDEWENIPCS